MFNLDQQKKDFQDLLDSENPIAKSINRMKYFMKHTQFQGLKDLMDITYFEGPSSFYSYYNSDKRVFANLGIPKELFYFLGVDMVFVEQLSAMVAVSSQNREIIGSARELVPSSTYCTFHQAALGAFEKEYFPIPDIFIAPSFVCEETTNLFTYLGEKYHRPVLYVDCPNNRDAESQRYLADQLERLANDIAHHFGIEIRHENIVRTFEYSNVARDWWLKFQDVRSQLRGNSLDITSQTLLLSTMLYSKFGLEKTIDVTRQCYDEVVARKEAEGSDRSIERPRILWMHIMPYHTSALLNILKKLRVNVAGDVMSQLNWEPLDPNEPWLSLARKYMSHCIYGEINHNLHIIDGCIQKFDIDAIIELCHPGCKPGSSQSYLVKQYLKKRGVPHLSIEADLIDPDNLSPAQIETRVEAFMEMLKKGTDNAKSR